MDLISARIPVSDDDISFLQPLFNFILGFKTVSGIEYRSDFWMHFHEIIILLGETVSDEFAEKIGGVVGEINNFYFLSVFL